MAAEPLGLEQETLSRYVKMSFIFHIALFLAFSVEALFFMDAPIEFEKAIRIDLVGLPDKITELPPAPAITKASKVETAAPKAEPKKEVVKLPPKTNEPEAINLDKTKNKQKSALEKLKQMEALESIQKDIEQDKKIAAATARANFKGNVISPGTELSGVNKLQAETYIDQVHKHMLDQWTLPEYLKNRKLRTDVLVKFDGNGNILEKEIAKSSGNPAFDEFVLSSIQKSSPVPPPPAKFVRISSLQGFLFRFSHDL